MEFITIREATKDHPGERIAIPDTVVAASHDRDLVAAYIAAPAERASLEQTAHTRLHPASHSEPHTPAPVPEPAPHD